MFDIVDSSLNHDYSNHSYCTNTLVISYTRHNFNNDRDEYFQAYNSNLISTLEQNETCSNLVFGRRQHENWRLFLSTARARRSALHSRFVICGPL